MAAGSQTRDRTRLYEIITGLLVLGMTVGGLLVGELALRAIQLARFGVAETVEKSSVFSIDQATGLRVIEPNVQLGQVRINNLGTRGPDVAVEKPDRTFRILFLGSSTTYDAASPEGGNWPHRSASNLGDRVSGCRVDFVNAGQPGFGTGEMLTFYDSRLARLDADLVVILPGDINQDIDWLAARQGLETTHYRPSLFAEHSVLWAKLEKNFRIIELQRGAFDRTGKVALDVPRLTDRFSQRLDALLNRVSADGAPVALALIGSQLRPEQSREQLVRAAASGLFFMPYVALPDIMAARDAYNAVIERTAAQHANVALVTASARVPGDPAHYEDTMHFTARGSGVMAAALTDELFALDAVQGRLRAAGCRVDG